MRIAHVVSTYPPYRAGMGNVAEAYVSRLRARGHEVEVFSLQSLRPILRAGNAGQIPQIFFRLGNFDVVHLHYPFFGGAEWVALAKQVGRVRRLVITYHMDARPSGWMKWVFRIYDGLLRQWILRQADVVLASSDSYIQSSALATDPVALKRTEILPFGFDPVLFHPGPEEALRREHGIGLEVPLLIFLGGMDRAHAFKGVPVLFDALEHLRELPWTLVLIGDGELRASYEQRTAPWQAGRVRFLGGVDDVTKARWLRSADLHLFPSTSRAEAFGLVTLEAMASGIPTIASDLPGVRDLVRQEETGLCVAPGDAKQLAVAIKRLLETPEKRKRLGAAAFERSQAYQWARLIDRLEAVYRRVVV